MAEAAQVYCPVCAYHKQMVGMIAEEKEFFKCPDCDTEVWPSTRKYKSIWGPKRVKMKGGHSSKGGRYKNKKQVKMIPWYQRERE